MIVFSTVLEVNGQPTIYSVYKNRSTVFLNPPRFERAPVLYATLTDSAWQIRGTEDANLVQQVLREIRD